MAPVLAVRENRKFGKSGKRDGKVKGLTGSGRQKTRGSSEELVRPF